MAHGKDDVYHCSKCGYKFKDKGRYDYHFKYFCAALYKFKQQKNLDKVKDSGINKNLCIEVDQQHSQQNLRSLPCNSHERQCEDKTLQTSGQYEGCTYTQAPLTVAACVDVEQSSASRKPSVEDSSVHFKTESSNSRYHKNKPNRHKEKSSRRRKLALKVKSKPPYADWSRKDREGQKYDGLSNRKHHQSHFKLEEQALSYQCHDCDSVNQPKLDKLGNSYPDVRYDRYQDTSCDRYPGTSCDKHLDDNENQACKLEIKRIKASETSSSNDHAGCAIVNKLRMSDISSKRKCSDGSHQCDKKDVMESTLIQKEDNKMIHTTYQRSNQNENKLFLSNIIVKPGTLKPWNSKPYDRDRRLDHVDSSIKLPSESKCTDIVGDHIKIDSYATNILGHLKKEQFDVKQEESASYCGQCTLIGQGLKDRINSTCACTHSTKNGIARKTEKKSYSFLQLDEESAVCIPRDSKLTKAEVGEIVNKDCLAEFVNSLLQPAYIHCDTDEIPVLHSQQMNITPTHETPNVQYTGKTVWDEVRSPELSPTDKCIQDSGHVESYQTVPQIKTPPTPAISYGSPAIDISTLPVPAVTSIPDVDNSKGMTGPPSLEPYEVYADNDLPYVLEEDDGIGDQEVPSCQDADVFNHEDATPPKLSPHINPRFSPVEDISPRNDIVDSVKDIEANKPRNKFVDADPVKDISRNKPRKCSVNLDPVKNISTNKSREEHMNLDQLSSNELTLKSHQTCDTEKNSSRGESRTRSASSELNLVCPRKMDKDVKIFEDEPAVSSETEDSDKYVCPKCGVHFRYELSLSRHVERNNCSRPSLKLRLCKSGQRYILTQPCMNQERKSVKKPRRKLKKGFRMCEHCSVYQCRSELRMQRHHQQCHTFKCDVCDQVFPFQDLLDTHFEEKHNIPYCDLCLLDFPLEDLLTEHMWTLHHRRMELAQRVAMAAAQDQDYSEILQELKILENKHVASLKEKDRKMDEDTDDDDDDNVFTDKDDGDCDVDDNGEDDGEEGDEEEDVNEYSSDDDDDDDDSCSDTDEDVIDDDGNDSDDYDTDESNDDEFNDNGDDGSVYGKEERVPSIDDDCTFLDIDNSTPVSSNQYLLLNEEDKHIYNSVTMQDAVEGLLRQQSGQWHNTFQTLSQSLVEQLHLVIEQYTNKLYKLLDGKKEEKENIVRTCSVDSCQGDRNSEAMENKDNDVAPDKHNNTDTACKQTNGDRVHVPKALKRLLSFLTDKDSGEKIRISKTMLTRKRSHNEVEEDDVPPAKISRSCRRKSLA
ncbi:uncharacterized protein LOC144447383 [Glandiceps talaboti]